MKIYVDEMPKGCVKCDFCDKDNGMCNVLGQYFRDGYDYTDCPLQSLAEHGKEIRKQVLDYLALGLVEFSEDFSMTKDEILDWLHKYKDKVVQDDAE